MKCTFCGFEHEENLNFCPSCGRQLTADALSLNPMADRFSNVLNDGLFLVICILMSVSAVVGLLFNGSLPIFEILFTIFLWLCFAQGKKGFIEHAHIRSISGTVFAYYIVNFVLSGILAVCGFVISAFVGLIQSSPQILEELMGEAELATLEEFSILEGFSDVIGETVVILFIIIATVVILINIFGIRKIHKFVQSVYKSVEYNENRIVFAKAARSWLIVLGALGIVGALLNITDSTSNALSIVAQSSSSLCGIFAGALINKHILVEQ